MRDENIDEVAAGVHLVHGSNVNWVIITDGDGVTLVDTGYLGDADALDRSIAAVGGRPQDVAAVLITHAHNDHLGSAARLGREHGVPVLMHEAEVPHARRDFLDQVSIGAVLANGWRPGVLPWAAHVIRSGGTKDVRVPMAQAFPGDGPLDLPGRPVPVPTPGHTPGHCAYHLPDAGVLITGDTLVTGHATSRQQGPQLLLPMFDGDRRAVVAALDALAAMEADILLPGHGPAHRGSAREAAALARERAAGTRR